MPSLPHYSSIQQSPIRESTFEISSENLPIQIKENIAGFGYDLDKEQIYLDIYATEENIKDIFLVGSIEDLSIKYHDVTGKVLLEISFTGIEDSPSISSSSNYSGEGLLIKKLTFNFKDHIVLLD